MMFSVFWATIYLVAWFWNGYFGTKFDLPALERAYPWIAGMLNFVHLTDSSLNTPLGKGKE